MLTGKCYSVEMDKHKMLADAKAELQRHVWGTFVDGKASVANSGTCVVVSGCEACRKRFGTNSQYLRHGTLRKMFCPKSWRILLSKASALGESRPENVNSTYGTPLYCFCC